MLLGPIFSCVWGKLCFAIFALWMEKQLPKGGKDLSVVILSYMHHRWGCWNVFLCGHVFWVAAMRAAFLITASCLDVGWSSCLGCHHGTVRWWSLFFSLSPFPCWEIIGSESSNENINKRLFNSDVPELRLEPFLFSYSLWSTYSKLVHFKNISSIAFPYSIYYK